MIEAKKNGRHILAILMDEPVNNVRGVVQCAISGCRAYMPVMDDADQEAVAAQIDNFLEHHECDPTRYPKRTTRKLVT